MTSCTRHAAGPRKCIKKSSRSYCDQDTWAAVEDVDDDTITGALSLLCEEVFSFLAKGERIFLPTEEAKFIPAPPRTPTFTFWSSVDASVDVAPTAFHIARIASLEVEVVYRIVLWSVVAGRL